MVASLPFNPGLTNGQRELFLIEFRKDSSQNLFDVSPINFTIILYNTSELLLYTSCWLRAMEALVKSKAPMKEQKVVQNILDPMTKDGFGLASHT